VEALEDADDVLLVLCKVVLCEAEALPELLLDLLVSVIVAVGMTVTGIVMEVISTEPGFVPLGAIRITVCTGDSITSAESRSPEGSRVGVAAVGVAVGGARSSDRMSGISESTDFTTGRTDSCSSIEAVG
jgi:hypothetical protein